MFDVSIRLTAGWSTYGA